MGVLTDAIYKAADKPGKPPAKPTQTVVAPVPAVQNPPAKEKSYALATVQKVDRYLHCKARTDKVGSVVMGDRTMDLRWCAHKRMPVMMTDCASCTDPIGAHDPLAGAAVTKAVMIAAAEKRLRPMLEKSADPQPDAAPPTQQVAAPAVVKRVGDPAKTLIAIHRKGYTKDYTPKLIAKLTASGWKAEDWEYDGGIDEIKTRLEKERPAAMLRWEEHGCLFGGKSWTAFVKWCYQKHIAPLSMDLGYFSHYKSLMVDRYTENGTSAITEDWSSMPEVPDWEHASPSIKAYRAKLQHDWDEAGKLGPVEGLEPGYVLVFLQFASHLSRAPFRAKTMEEWASLITKKLQGAGHRVVLKASPVGPYPEISNAPLFRSTKHGDVNPVQNVRLLQFSKWSVICCSSVSNEMVILNLPIMATGRSWFVGLDVFTEATTFDNLVLPPKVNASARGRWINWWLQHQFERDSDPEMYLQSAIDRFRARVSNTVVPKAHTSQPRLEIVLEALGMTTANKLLDVGCGHGHLIKETLAKGFNSYGLDITKLPGEGIPKWRKVNGSVMTIPFKDNTFDVSVCMATLEHLRACDVDKAMDELKRVSKKWLILSFGEPPEGWSALYPSVRTFDEWCALVEAKGLKILHKKYNGVFENCVLCEKVG